MIKPPPALPSPRCRLRVSQTGASCELGVGGSIRLGSAGDNDLVCDDPSVARYHARALWAKDVPLPVVCNNATPEALRLDGVRVYDMAPLRDGARLEVGSVELLVELLDLPETQDQTKLLAEFSEPGTMKQVTTRLKALLVPRTVSKYELTLPSAEDCLAALGRVMSAAQAEEVWVETCASAGLSPGGLDELDNLEEVVQRLRRKGGLIQIVALSLSIRIDSYRCLRAKAGR